MSRGDASEHIEGLRRAIARLEGDAGAPGFDADGAPSARVALAAGSRKVKVPDGWAVSPGSVPLAHAAAAKNGTTDFLVKPGLLDQRGYALHADAACRQRHSGTR